ncbi:MAG: helix-turn-helix domain-containing protein [Gemmatimonadaceae bacterium]
MTTHHIEHETEFGKWRLTRADPAPDLANFVHEYWEVEGALSPFREALLPNGFVEIMANLGPSHRVLTGHGAGEWNDAWYSGLQERSIYIESLRGTHLVSARLHPLAAAALFGASATTAANSIVDLRHLAGDHAAVLRDTLRSAPDAESRFAILEATIRSWQARATDVPDFVREAATNIDAAHGNLRIADLHAPLGISRKHLAVTFARHMGISPKRYANIRRFLWTLDRLRESTDVSWTTLAADAGYSDQSHLVRDFRRIGAASPTEYLRRFDPDVTALLEPAGNDG